MDELFWVCMCICAVNVCKTESQELKKKKTGSMMGITHLNRVKNTQNIILFFQITYGVIGTRRHAHTHATTCTLKSNHPLNEY